MDYEAIIQNYKSRCKSPLPGWCYAKKQKEYCLNAHDLKDAVMKAAVARDQKGKMHSHQRRVSDRLETLKQKLLQRESKIQEAHNFDELLQTVAGTGVFIQSDALTYYDTSLRLGFYLNKLPQKIYLHAGTRTGAENLLGKSIDAPFLLKKDLPEPFKNCDLSEYELEDLLCIYKDEFQTQRKKL